MYLLSVLIYYEPSVCYNLFKPPSLLLSSSTSSYRKPMASSPGHKTFNRGLKSLTLNPLTSETVPAPQAIGVSIL